jgi:nucleotide-binding universal stress UspA family protein
LPGALDQRREHSGRSRREFHFAPVGPEPSGSRIEAVAAEANLLLTRRHFRLSRRLLGS